MKAIGIVGSPRKNGNTDTLVQAVLDGAKEAGYQTEKYYLNEMSYMGCQGCGYCKAHENCQLKDDVSKLLEALQKADAIVFGSPIYFFQFTGQFRLMEDRMYSLVDSNFNSRVKPGKKAVIVTSQGNPDENAFNGAIQEFANVLKLVGIQLTGIVKMANGGSPDAVKSRKDLLEKAMALGKAF